ncbi:MAG: hypothetical protein JWL99_3878, partial [Streptomyces oryziradicis]|nr:hypothetical protein [Actinacidiphila oryziradicis]
MHRVGAEPGGVVKLAEQITRNPGGRPAVVVEGAVGGGE